MSVLIPRSKSVQIYVTKIRRECPSENLMDIYFRFNKAVRLRKPVIVIHCPKLAKVIKKWIVLGERLKFLGTSLSLCSLILNHFGWYKESLALASGGLAIQSFYSFGWSRDSISGYILQPLEKKSINEDAVLKEVVVLVRKPKTGSYLVRGALTFSAVAVSAYLLWISM